MEISGDPPSNLRKCALNRNTYMLGVPRLATVNTWRDSLVLHTSMYSQTCSDVLEDDISVCVITTKLTSSCVSTIG